MHKNKKLLDPQSDISRNQTTVKKTQAGDQPATSSQNPQPTLTGVGEAPGGQVVSDSNSGALSRPSQPTILLTEKILLTKMQWANQELSNSTSVEHCTQLCALVKACADAIKSVRDLETKDTMRME